jgi:hypothetical protein
MGLARRALFGLVGVSAMLWLAAAPVAAIPPSFWFRINVSDCKTGAPIRAGVGVFAIQNFPAAAVAPLANGVIGPIGLGDFNFVTNISSPGYRTGHWVLHGTGVQTQAETVDLCLHPDKRASEKLVDTTYSINVTCTSAGDVCDPTFTTAITTDEIAQVQFIAGSSNCTSISVAIGIDGSIFISDPLAPGDTAFNSWSPLAPGAHTLTVQATGVGCGTGTLSGWSGTLLVTTSAPV